MIFRNSSDRMEIHSSVIIEKITLVSVYKSNTRGLILSSIQNM